MINDNTYKYELGVVNYLNGYPAFMTGTSAATINNAFYNRYMKHLVYYADPSYNSLTADGRRLVKEWIDNSGFTDKEYADYVEPVIQKTWARGRSLYAGKITMEMAQAFLRFIEPYWCKFKNISSTGYIKDNSVILNDEDEMFDI